MNPDPDPNLHWALEAVNSRKLSSLKIHDLEYVPDEI